MLTRTDEESNGVGQMRHMKPFNFILFLTLASWILPQKSWSEKKLHEIKVELFNQPCLLQGPIETSVLRKIHAISPEQIFPPSLERSSLKIQQESIRKSLKLIKTNIKLPQEFQKYTQRMERRLEAFNALFDGLEKIKKTNDTKDLFTSVSPHFQNKSALEEFSKIMSELKPKLKEISEETLDQIKQSIKNGIEPDSEEDFHKALLRASIQYNCSMDEKGSEGNP